MSKHGYPLAPEPPTDFVEPPREFDTLKRRLLDTRGDVVGITAALKGAGGYGKTTLARALAHDADIQDAHFDGMLWVELGQKPDNLLSILKDQIELLTGERPNLESLSAATGKFSQALGQRRILLVIDDVWRTQDLWPLLQGGPNTSRLVTTRVANVLPYDARRQTVDAMTSGEALRLLSSGFDEMLGPCGSTETPMLALQALANRLG